MRPPKVSSFLCRLRFVDHKQNHKILRMRNTGWRCYRRFIMHPISILISESLFIKSTIHMTASIFLPPLSTHTSIPLSFNDRQMIYTGRKVHHVMVCHGGQDHSAPGQPSPEHQQPHRTEIRSDSADFQDPHDPLFRNHGFDLFQRQHIVFLLTFMTNQMLFIIIQPAMQRCQIKLWGFGERNCEKGRFF